MGWFGSRRCLRLGRRVLMRLAHVEHRRWNLLPLLLLLGHWKRLLARLDVVVVYVVIVDDVCHVRPITRGELSLLLQLLLLLAAHLVR